MIRNYIDDIETLKDQAEYSETIDQWKNRKISISYYFHKIPNVYKVRFAIGKYMKLRVHFCEKRMLLPKNGATVVTSGPGRNWIEYRDLIHEKQCAVKLNVYRKNRNHIQVFNKRR